MRIRLLGQYIPASIVVRAVIELALLFAMVYGAAVIRLHQGIASIESSQGPLWPRALLFTGVTFACQLALGLHSARQRARSGGIFVRILAAVAFGVGVSGAALFLIPNLWIGRGVVALAGLGAGVVALILHVFFARVIDERVFKVRVLVYGAGRSAEAISGLRRRADRRGFTVVGYVRPAAEELENLIAGRSSPASEPVFEGSVGLPELCKRFDVDEIVVAVDDRRRSFPIRELLECRLAGVDVTELLTFLERESGRVRIDVLNPSWIIFGEGFRRGSLRQLTARALDLVAGVVIVLLSVPAIIITVVAIKIEDGLGAPVLYRQERVGLGGRMFTLKKFRSMDIDAEAPAGLLSEAAEVFEDRRLAFEVAAHDAAAARVPYDVVGKQLVERGHVAGRERRVAATHEILVRVCHDAPFRKRSAGYREPSFPDPRESATRRRTRPRCIPSRTSPSDA